MQACAILLPVHGTWWHRLQPAGTCEAGLEGVVEDAAGGRGVAGGGYRGHHDASAAVFMLVVSAIALRTGFLPRWLVLAGFVGGLVFLFTVTYVELLVLILPPWITAVSVVILRAGGRRLSGATS